VLNDFHTGACVSHFFGLETSKKILCARYFWTYLIKECIEAIKKWDPCQIFSRKMWEQSTPMFPVIVVDPFTKWGIDFTTCHPDSARGHRYIIKVVEYFTKWVEAMTTFSNEGENTTFFIFNQIVARFNIPKDIFIDHGSHFQNKMMIELLSNLRFNKEHLSTLLSIGEWSGGGRQ
jgi:hypothetical protein